jgi:superfamily I DNA and/or RNA helicase
MKTKKELEDYVLKKAPIIVCTCMSSKSSRMEKLTFRKVIIDEAA